MSPRLLLLLLLTPTAAAASLPWSASISLPLDASSSIRLEGLGSCAASDLTCLSALLSAAAGSPPAPPAPGTAPILRVRRRALPHATVSLSLPAPDAAALPASVSRQFRPCGGGRACWRSPASLNIFDAGEYLPEHADRGAGVRRASGGGREAHFGSLVLAPPVAALGALAGGELYVEARGGRCAATRVGAGAPWGAASLAWTAAAVSVTRAHGVAPVAAGRRATLILKLWAPLRASARPPSPDQLLAARAGPAGRALGRAAARAFVAGVCAGEFASANACHGATSRRMPGATCVWCGDSCSLLVGGSYCGPIGLYTFTTPPTLYCGPVSQAALDSALNQSACISGLKCPNGTGAGNAAQCNWCTVNGQV